MKNTSARSSRFFDFELRIHWLEAKAALLLFIMVALMAGGTTVVRAQSAVDGFDPTANSQVFSVVVQTNGQVLIGGQFTMLKPNGGATVTRNFIARLNPDGTLDTAFNPNPNFYVRAIALQADGKIVIGGDFTSLSPNGGSSVTRRYIARLHPDGTLDASFDPWTTGSVVALAIQPDGKILLGGNFGTFYPNGESPGITRNRIARLDPTTGVPDSFNPNGNGEVLCMALQTDGKILAGGAFTTIGGQTRNRIARLDATTGLADTWDPNANNLVWSVAIQADGKILAGGDFNPVTSTTTIGGQTRNRIARLDATTGLADTWDPNGNGTVNTMVVQTDGKILVGGAFSNLGGQPRLRMARLDAVTGLADSFDPNVLSGSAVNSIAVQSDGKILVGGAFLALAPNGGASVARSCIARLEAPTLIIQRDATTNIVFSWPTNFPGFTLEVSTNLSANVWDAVLPAPVVSGTNNVVTNSISGPARFYRLRQ